MWGGCSGDDNGKMNWRRNAEYRRAVRWLVQIRSCKDFNCGHDIMGCIYRRGWSVAAFPSKREYIWELPNKIMVVKVLGKWCGVGAVKEKR